eukprot:Filipodium_phascolosomae@DN8297_c0_g1_i1.p1
MLPFVLIAIGIGAYAAKTGIKAYRLSGIKASQLFSQMPLMPKNSLFARRLTGFETTLSQSEAYKILNVNPTASRDRIKEVHRKLMLANHPDKGGSDFLASKVNEAKDCLMR